MELDPKLPGQPKRLGLQEHREEDKMLQAGGGGMEGTHAQCPAEG